MFTHVAARGALACSLLALACAAHAAVDGRTPDGIAFVEGGIGQDEVQSLQAESRRYTLRVRTAARGSGAYLTDVDLSIRDAARHVVFQ
jgi:hypothetical protein